MSRLQRELSQNVSSGFSRRIFIRGVGAVSAAAGVAALLTACGGSATATSADGVSTLVLLNGLDAVSLDPAQSDTGNWIQYVQPMYETLVRIMPDGELVPALAASWEYSDAAQTVLVLSLREGVTFSDGEALTATAVKANIERFAAANGPRSSALAAVAAVDATDELTVTITLSSADPALLFNFGQNPGMMVSPAVLDGDVNATPIGAGPYVYDAAQSTLGDHYVYVRNDNYYEPDAIEFDSIRVNVIAEETARVNALVSGQGQGAQILPSYAAQVEGAGLTVEAWSGDVYGLFIVDRAGSLVPALGDVRVRQAINYAIDGAAILEQIQLGFGTATNQILSTGSEAYVPALDERYPYDPDTARSLLAEAGYADGFAITMPDKPFFGGYSAIIKQQLADVGIQVTYEASPAAEGYGRYNDGNFAMFMFCWGASQPWLDATSLFVPGGPWNPFDSTDPEVEALMQTITVTSGDEQAAAYQALNTWIVENAWFGMMFASQNLYAHPTSIDVATQFGSNLPFIPNFTQA